MDAEQKQQLTIRLDTSVIEQLDAIVNVLQKTAPKGVVLTRTDALRSSILRGIDTIRAQSAKERSTSTKSTKKA
jgi:hypothetical protein